MKEQFTQWYAGRVAANLKKGNEETVDLRISVVKPIHARWIVSALDRVAKDSAGVTRLEAGWITDCVIRLYYREREMFYLTTHSTHFIYGYMVSDIWLRTILIVRKETRCHHIGYSYRLTARVLLYAPSHRQDNTYHSLCYTSRGALAGTRNSSMGPPHEGSIRRPTAP